MGYAPGEREKIAAMIAEKQARDEQEKKDREWAEQMAAWQAKEAALRNVVFGAVPLAVAVFAALLGQSVRAYRSHDIAWWLIQGAGVAAFAAFFAQSEIRYWYACMAAAFVLAVASLLALG